MNLNDSFWKDLLDRVFNRTAVIVLARTGAAAAGAAVIAFLANQLGIQLPDDAAPVLEGIVFALLTGGWNALVVWLETNVNYRFGWLLLVPKAPEYDGAESAAAEDAVIEALAANDAYWLDVVHSLTESASGKQEGA